MGNFNVGNSKYQELIRDLKNLGFIIKTTPNNSGITLTVILNQKTDFQSVVSFDIYQEEDITKLLEEISLVEKINTFGENPVTVIAGRKLPQPGHGYLEYYNKDNKFLNIDNLTYMAMVEQSNANHKVDSDFLNLQFATIKATSTKHDMDDLKSNYKNLVSAINRTKSESNKVMGVRKKIPTTLTTNVSVRPRREININEFVSSLSNQEKINNLIDSIIESINLNYDITFSINYGKDLDQLEIFRMNNVIRIIKEKVEALTQQMEQTCSQRQSILDEAMNKANEINASNPHKAYEELMEYNPDLNAIEEFKYKAKYVPYKAHDFYYTKSAAEKYLPGNSSRISGFYNTQTYYENIENDSLVELQQRQNQLLTQTEKEAVMVYKAQLYRAMNQVLEYMRKNNISYNEAVNNDEVMNIVQQAYKEYKEGYDNARKSGDKSITTGSPVADKAFGKYQDYNGFMTFENYAKVTFIYLPYVESALNKVKTTEDITVYRGVPKERADIPKHFMSTSLSPAVARDFIVNRANNQSDDFLGFYEIKIPAGSPVIVYNEQLFKGYGENKNYLGDQQQELLIDPSLYDFKYVPESMRTNYTKVNGQERILTYQQLEATPKSLELEQTEGSLSM